MSNIIRYKNYILNKITHRPKYPEKIYEYTYTYFLHNFMHID